MFSKSKTICKPYSHSTHRNKSCFTFLKEVTFYLGACTAAMHYFGGGWFAVIGGILASIPVTLLVWRKRSLEVLALEHVAGELGRNARLKRVYVFELARDYPALISEFISMFGLGFAVYGVIMMLGHASAEEHLSLHRFLVENGMVLWLSSMAVFMTIVARLLLRADIYGERVAHIMHAYGEEAEELGKAWIA